MEIIAENVPNLGKKINIHTEEVFRTVNRYDHRRTSSCCIRVIVVGGVGCIPPPGLLNPQNIHTEKCIN